MSECTFCKLYENRECIIYENEFFWAQYDKFPVSPGHAEVIPKRHVASLLDLTDDEWVMVKPSISEVIKKIEKSNFSNLYKVFIDNPVNEKSVEYCKKMLSHMSLKKKPEAYNIGVNEGKAAGRTIDHLHIHIIPRFLGDVEDYIGGIRHVIPGMGNYKR